MVDAIVAATALEEGRTALVGNDDAFGRLAALRVLLDVRRVQQLRVPEPGELEFDRWNSSCTLSTRSAESRSSGMGARGWSNEQIRNCRGVPPFHRRHGPQ